MGKPKTLAQKRQLEKKKAELKILYGNVINEISKQFDTPVFPEFEFAEGRKFAFDFFFSKFRLGVEFEGGQGWAGHAEHNRYRSDMEKYNLANMLGYWVLRFTEDDARYGIAKAQISLFIRRRLNE